MPLGTLGSGLGPYWAYVAPVERINYADNPSYERGTAGAAQVQSATLGSTAGAQAFGAWSLWFTPSNNGTSGAFLGTVQAQSGTNYTASAYVNGSVGVDYFLTVTDTSNALVGSTPFTGGGTWQRYSVTYAEASSATRRIAVRKANGANSASTGTVYADAWQFEVGSLTTYIDGDQDGCQWLGAPHASQSIRSGQSRAGGSVIALADIGFYVDDATGIGMPPLENSYQSYAIIDGAQYQRTRAGARPFTLSATPISGTSHQDYHAIRRRVINALKIDVTTPQQPTRFWYIGAGGTVQIDAVLDAGLEGGETDGPSAENIGVRFLAFDPFWESTTQQGTALAPRVSLGSTNYIAWRDPGGRWGTLGANGTTLRAAPTDVTAIQKLMWAPSGTLWFVGTFGSVGPVATFNMGYYTPQTNTFGAIGATTALIWSATMLPDESIYIGGTLSAIGGTTGANNIGYYRPGNTNVGSVVGGTTGAGIVRALYYSNTGTLFAGGEFLTVAGTTAPRAAAYSPSAGAWGTLTGGTIGAVAVGDTVYAITQGQSGTVYLGGFIQSVNGGSANGMIFWAGGAFGTIPIGIRGGGTIIYDMAVAPDQRVYIGGDFGSANNQLANNVAVYNGAYLQPLGSGFPNTGQALIHRVAPLADGRVVFGGTFQGTAGGVTMIDNVAFYNGYTFLPIDIDLPGAARVSDVLVNTLGTMFVAFRTTGTAQAPSVTQVVNSGMAQAYPTFVFRNPGTINQNIYELNNATTGDYMFFQLAILPSETLTLTLTPGARSFTSSYGRNVFGNILGGSNLATWKLLPGTNSVVCFADGSVQTSMYWTPRSWSADAGTTF